MRVGAFLLLAESFVVARLRGDFFGCERWAIAEGGSVFEQDQEEMKTVSKKKMLPSILACIMIGLLSYCTTAASAADVKIGVMDIQKVLLKSRAGVKAKAKFDKKAGEIMARFGADRKALAALQSEIFALKTEMETKGSLWSKEKKAEKIRERDDKVLELNRKSRDFQTKTKDAQAEMSRLQDKEFEPILKTLEEVVTAYAKDRHYTCILDGKSGLLYYDAAVDISDELVREMDRAMK